MQRFGFNIRTKSGQRVDNIQIMAATAGDAERRLRQMYMQCEVIERRAQPVPRRLDTPVVEAVPQLAGSTLSARVIGTQ